MVKRNQELNKQAIELFDKMRTQKADPSQTAADTDGKPPEEAKQAPASASGATNDATTLQPEEAKKQADELKEVMKIAQQIEKAEEEDLMKRALEES